MFHRHCSLAFMFLALFISSCDQDDSKQVELEIINSRQEASQALSDSDLGKFAPMGHRLMVNGPSAMSDITIDSIPFRILLEKGNYTIEIHNQWDHTILFAKEMSLREDTVIDLAKERFESVSVSSLILAAKSGRIRSVEELLKSLPQEMLDNFVLMENSGSRHISSLEHPRMILFGVDARIIIGISTEPTDPNFDTVELMEFEEYGKSWKLRALTFGDLETYENNDNKCQICHGHPARPIWGSYRHWPGAFGNDDDGYKPEQIKILRKAKDKTSRNERLNALNISFYNGSDGRDSIQIATRYYGYNNTVFNQELSPLQALAIHHRISSHKDYQSLKKFIVALALNNACDLENYPASQSLEQLIFTVNLLQDQYELARNIYTYLGAEMNRDFTLGHPLFLLEDAAIDDYDDIRWFGAFNILHQDVSLLILNEILEEKPAVAKAVSDIRDIIDNTYWYSFLLKGNERGEVIKTRSIYMGGDSFFRDFFAQLSNRDRFCDALLN